MTISSALESLDAYSQFVAETLNQVWNALRWLSGPTVAIQALLRAQTHCCIWL